MYSALITLLGAAIFTTAAVLITRWVSKTLHSERAEAAAKAVVAPDSKGFTHTADLVSSSAIILTLDGECRISRTMSGLRANANVDLTTLKGQVRTSGTIVGNPRLVDISPFTRDRVTFVPDASGGSGSFTLSFRPPLTASDPPLEFTVESDFSHGFLMKRDDVLRMYAKDPFAYEYYGVRVDIPVKQVRIEVRFPADFRSEVGAAALGTSETRVVSESERIAGNLTKEGTSAVLVVKDPILSYQYVIHWLPVE